LLEAIKTAFKLPDLRKKIFWTLALLGIFRLGSFIPVPGPWDSKILADFFGEGNNLFGLLDMLAGGALKRMSIFAMSVNPYITSSIIMQLLTMAIPYLEQLAKEGVEGRKVISQYTRYGTVVLSVIQGAAMAFGLAGQGALRNPTAWDYILIITSLTAGSVFLMWLGEVISERGIGNGISMLIFAGIVARIIPSSFEVLKSAMTGGGLGPSFFSILAFVVLAVAIVAGVVFVTQGERKIPVQYAKRVVGRKMYGGGATYLPMKVNQAGVIPIIFASSILAFPPTLGSYLPTNSWIFKLLTVFYPGRPLYLVLYAIFIFVFTYFYTAVTFNPADVANNMKKYSGFIPGIRPGKPTAEYLDRVLTRITLAGALFLTAISLLPYAMGFIPGFKGMAVQFGGTSLLIAVGVALDTMRQIESQLLMRQYEGFLK
jgi:preprotein translocase subunit SecY